MINIVLYEPEIPQNTGNIIRTCAAFNCKLHLIEPLGFDWNEKAKKRAEMDYAALTDIKTYENWDKFMDETKAKNLYFVTRYGKKDPSKFEFKSLDGEIYIVLGKESTGIPKSILRDHLDTCMRLPMVEQARSLNLSNCAAIMVFEVQRQLGFLNLSTHEVIKGEDWLLEE